MSEASPSQLTTCSECGADDAPAGGRCWLCHAQVPGAAQAAEPRVYQAQVVQPPAHFRTGEIISAIALLAIIVVLALMGIGMATEEPGMIIPFLVVVMPALVATGGRGLSRRMQGDPLSWSQRLLTFIVSGAVTLGVLGLLCAAIVAAFFIYCVVAMTQMGYP